ncbi:hypothetical protein POPTR_018G026300v4 [Populus trichocarpa]|uniref:Uncharacterized protein n=1 Tax=Populus trichocarpa TaxID=3694 RepID=A0ACC0RN42_POPTR|nr:hypothetical protein POPTR_018G026300v4 [Populus trichocarpa]
MKPQSCMIHPVLHQVNGTPTNLRKFEEKKIEVAEATSKQVGETNKALEDLRRVNKLLADVRSELISSQKSLTELEERRTSIMSYMTSLTDAEIEARNKELGRELSTEKELIEELQKELEKGDCLWSRLSRGRFFYSRNRIRKILKFGGEVNQEVAELKTLISSNEELVRATATTLKDKEEHVQIMQDELNNTRSSRVKEMEVLAAQRAPTIKYEELKIVLERLDTKEKELKNLKEAAVEDANDPRKLYSLARERIGERSIRNLAIKKLKLEAVQLEVEAATGDPQKLAETSRELLNKASLCIEANADSSTSMKNGSDPDLVLLENNYVSRRLKQSHR